MESLKTDRTPCDSRKDSENISRSENANKWILLSLALITMIAGVALAASPVYQIETLATPRTGNMSTQFLFVVNITNIGDHNLTNINVSANYSDSAFLFVNASPAPSSAYNNSINWTNIVTNLAPNRSYAINVTLIARNISSTMNTTFAVSSYATNGTDAAAASSSTEVEITWYNLLPYFNTTPSLNTTIGLNYTYDADATDPNGDTITYSLQANPFGMQINSASGLLWWAPNSTQNGSFTVTVNASDGKNGSALQTYTLNVSLNATAGNGSNATNGTNTTNYPPNITTTPTGNATVNATYYYDANATDYENETITWNLTSYPAGMTVNSSTGLITWMPNSAQVGLFNATIYAIDPNGSSSQNWTINISPVPNYPPNITGAPMLNATEDLQFQYNISAFDPENGTLLYLIVNAPSGMTLGNNTGRINWTPNNTHVGLNAVVVNVTDNQSNSAIQNYTINVSNVPANFTTTPVTGVVANNWLFYDANATDDGQGNATYSLSLSPAGMTVDLTTGLVSWQPTAAQMGANAVVLTVNDGNGGIVSQAYNVTVTTPFQIIFTGPALQNMSALANYTFLARNLGNYTLQNVSLDIVYNATDMNISSFGAVVFNGNNSFTNPLVNITNTSGRSITSSIYNLSAYGNASIIFTFLLFNKSANWTTNLTLSAYTQSNETMLIGNASLNTTIAYVNYAPYFTSTPPSAIIVTTIPYGYQAAAYDANGDTLVFGLMTSPSGMTINSSTGMINWTPTLLQTGMINVTLNASDGKGGVAIQSYLINSTRYNSPPTFTTLVAPNATEDSAYSFDVNASDGENDTLTHSLDVKTDGMTINSATGAISWTANNTQVGNATARVNASDGMGNLTQITYSINVLNNPPSVNTAPGTTAIQGVAYSYDANSDDDGQGNVTYWLMLSPAGMTINLTTGLVGWTPSLPQVGLNSVTLRVLDGNGGIGEQNFTINVSSALVAAAGSYPLPVPMSQQVNVTVNATSIGSRTMSNLTLGVWYNATDLTFVSSMPGASGNAVNGSIPFTNLSINLANGQTGTVVLTFLAMNRTTSWNTTIYSLFNVSDNGTIVGQNTSTRADISFVNFAPQITSSPVITAYVNQTYVYNASAVDGNGDILSYSLTAYPTNMTIDNATGAITWTPVAPGNSTVTVQANDGRGGSASQSWTIESRVLNYGPNITTSPGFFATEDSLFTYDVNATDLNGDVITYYLKSGPSGMTINSTTGLVLFTPTNTQAGTIVVTVRAMDPYGINDSQSWTLTINNNPPNFTTTPSTSIAERMNYTYDANSTDDGQGTIYYFLDLSPGGMLIENNTGRINWTPTTMQTGAQNVSVRVTDGNGGQAVQNFTINVTDTTPPNVTLVSPANATVYRNNSANVTFVASDNAGIASCNIGVNGTTFSMYSASGTLNQSVSVTSNISLSTGWNNVTVTCTDKSGLSNVSTSIILFTDQTPPVVTITSPVSGGNTSGNATLTYSVSDATTDKTQIIVNGAFVMFGNASGTIVLSMSEGLGQSVMVLANDSVGWTSNASVTFNVDRTAPVAQIGANAALLLKGQNGAVLNASGANSSDSLGITGYAWDFDAADGASNGEAGTQNATKNYTSKGAYIVTLSVTDVAGNIGRANTTVTVAQDTDGDGFPDDTLSGHTTDTCPLVYNTTNSAAACVNDTDGDGVTDATDFIYGNISQVMGNAQGLALLVGSTTNPNTASGMQNITITQNGNNLIQFSWNLANTTRLYVHNITILRQTGGILIAGLPYPINKTVWLPKDSSSYNSVCVKDVAAQSFAEISSSCTGSSEIQVNCTGANQGKTCADIGSYFQVTNLAYTIITSMTVGASSSSSNTTTVVTVNGAQAIVTGSSSSGSGGSFDARSGSDSDSRTVSQSYTPFNAGATPVPTTTPAASEPKAISNNPELVIVDSGDSVEEVSEPAQEDRPTDSSYYVGSAAQEGALTTVLIVLVVMMGLLVMVAIIAALVWALKR